MSVTSSCTNKGIIILSCGKKRMQNNFIWYFKFHASRPTIFCHVQLSLICCHTCLCWQLFIYICMYMYVYIYIYIYIYIYSFLQLVFMLQRFEKNHDTIKEYIKLVALDHYTFCNLFLAQKDNRLEKYEPLDLQEMPHIVHLSKHTFTISFNSKIHSHVAFFELYVVNMQP